mgnify:CR=1 FL=1
MKKVRLCFIGINSIRGLNNIDNLYMACSVIDYGKMFMVIGCKECIERSYFDIFIL